MRESCLESVICTKTKQRGGIALKWVSPGFSGVPDRILFFPKGRVIFVEVKAPGGRLSLRQKRVIEKLTHLNQVIWVIDDIVDFERRLDSLGI